MLDFGQIERHNLFSSFPFSFFIWLLGSRAVYLDLSPDPLTQTTQPTLATIDDRVPSSEFETGGSVGKSLHEKPTPTDPTHLHLSQTQIRWDLAKFEEILTRPFWDSAKFQRDLTKSLWDLVDIQPILTAIAAPLVLTKTEAVHSKQNWTEPWFPTVGNGSNFLSPEAIESISSSAQTQPRPTHEQPC